MDAASGGDLGIKHLDLGLSGSESGKGFGEFGAWSRVSEGGELRFGLGEFREGFVALHRESVELFPGDRELVPEGREVGVRGG